MKLLLEHQGKKPDGHAFSHDDDGCEAYGTAYEAWRKAKPGGFEDDYDGYRIDDTELLP